MSSLEFSTIRGDTWQGATFTLSQSGSPVNITGATFKMQVRKTSCTDAVLEWSTIDNTIVIDDPTNGHFYFEPRIIDITPSTYKFDCEMTLNNQVNTIFNGQWIISEDYTR